MTTWTNPIYRTLGKPNIEAVPPALSEEVMQLVLTQRLLTISQVETLTAERDAAREQSRRDREYTTSQTGESVKLANQVLALQIERDSLLVRLQVMQNERDEARALGRCS